MEVQFKVLLLITTEESNPSKNVGGSSHLNNQVHACVWWQMVMTGLKQMNLEI